MKTFLRFFSRVLALLACVAALQAQAQGSMVRVHTTLGPIDMTLVSDAPFTTTNFLAYVRGADYNDVLFHRSAYNGTAPFVIQSGGYRWTATGACCQQVTSRGAIPNEFSRARSNLRGTVAMAKLGGDPNSATSQWFVNMGDNSINLDNQNGGFTVFARVTTPGMVVADRIAALPRVNANDVFSELPVVDWQGGTSIVRANTVRINEVTEFPANPTSSDRIFNYLEAAYPQFLQPSKGVTSQALGYIYRYYGASNAYVGTKDGQVWYLVPAINGNINSLGTMDNWLATAQGAGY